MGFPGAASGKEPPCQCRRCWKRRFHPWWHGNPLQYSCLENSMDRGARWATVHGVTKSRTWLKWLSVCARARAHTHTHNMKCTSNLEIWFVFIPKCPEGSSKRTSMHLGVRQVCVLSRVKRSLTPLNLDLRQSFMFSDGDGIRFRILMR